jgi:transglutaminase-like putative cysteine protease
MRKFLVPLLVLFILTCVLIPGCGRSNDAQGLYEQAQTAFKAFHFAKARELYNEAREKAASESGTAIANKAREGLQTLEAYNVDYSFDESQMKAELSEAYPNVSESERNSWITGGKLEHVTIDGKPRYLSTSVENVAFRNMDLFHANQKMTEGYNKGVGIIYQEFVNVPRPAAWQNYTNPVSFKGTGTISVPRDKLPKTGTLQIWVPVPIMTAPQPGATVMVAEPAEYVKFPPATGDIGDVYFEVALDKLTEDLNTKVEFLLTHLEQHFVVNPAKVGKYNKNDAEYKEYTRSFGNTQYTPEITAKAREIIGGETNPYLAAKKLYNYVTNKVTYSFIPESSYWPRGKPISVYVHENQFGDCGGQSMYFSALCRSQGIPARATGGWQLLSGKFQTHFWAEFFLPNYGWVPVDTSIAQMADYTTNMTDEQKNQFKEYYFGNMDNLRCVIQKSVDTPVVPRPSQMLSSTGCLQAPDALCDTMEEIPGVFINEYWTLEAQKLTQ